MRILVTLPLMAVVACAAGTPYLTEPSLCPTRPEIAFVSGGDIWVAPSAGGEAHILVAHPAEESRPLYSPDGTKLAFMSTRTGGGDIYILTLATDELKRLTFDDGSEQLDAWSRDGKWIYFSTGAHDVGRKNDIYRVSAEGGTPMPVSADRFTNEFQAAPAPDGSTIAFSARGVSDSQWWRHGHSHLDESEIWLRKDSGAYEKLVDLGGRNIWPMWMPDGHSLYFMSDRTGPQNIWSLTVGAKPRQVTKFTDGRVLWPSMGYDGKSIVFERDFKIWKLDTKTGEAFQLNLKLMGMAAGPGTTHLTLNTFTDLALSPDSRKIAVIAHGEVFASGAREGGEAARVTNTPGPEIAVSWSPDSTKVVYVSPRNAVNHVFVYDFTKHTETQLTKDALPDNSPRYSPDGKMIAYVRERRELRIVDPETKQEKSLVSGSIAGGFAGGAFAWSPDSKWLAYAAAGGNGLRNVYVVQPTGEPHQISFLANSNVNSLRWSPDGTYILYETSQRTETPEVARINLIPPPAKFTEERFEDLFKPEPPARGRGGAAGSNQADKPPVKPVVIVFEGIRERISFLPIGLSVNNVTISPDGKSLLFGASVGGQNNLYLYSLDAEAGGRGGRGGRGGGGGGGARQLTSTSGQKSHPQFSTDSKEVYFLEAGRVTAIPVDTRVARTVNVNAEMDVDFATEKMAVFEQAWAGQRDQFYDSKYHGHDWNEVRAQYTSLVEGAQTPEELHRLLRMMVGELNSSHSGVTGPAGGGGRGATTGQLGMNFDRAIYETSGTLKITEVIPHSPAELAKIKVGEELRGVDGVPIATHVNLDELLQHKVDKRVTLDVSGHEVIVRPVGSLAEQIYRKWIEDNRAYVSKISNGRLGYVHIRDMSEQALTQLYIDLDAENRARDGVVIDIRNNNGGFVNAYALDVLARRPYLTMTGRGAPPAPARTQLGQRSLELPTILVVNQHSLSDAEDFTEGYRTLKLGKVVGEPTAGWIIYTGSMELIDGASMRTPGTLVQGSDGKNMENNPRPVDIAVTRPIGESYLGKDSQLDAAVKELLSEIGPKK